MKAFPRLLLLPALLFNLVAGAQEEIPSIDTLTDKLLNGDTRERRDAAYVLNQMGKAAEPAVPALIKALKDDQQQVWFHSLMTLAEIGPGAKDAVPALMEGLTRGGYRRGRSGGPSQVWYRSAYALGKIGQPAVPALTKALEHENGLVRAGAAKSFTWIKPIPADIIPALIRQLKDDNEMVRRYSAQTLGDIGSPALPALKTALAREETTTGAAVALGWMGTNAQEACPDLVQALNRSEDSDTKIECLNALSRLRYDPSEFTPLLFTVLKDADDDLQHTVYNALLLIRPAEEYTVPRLTEMLKNGNPDDVEHAALLLGRLGESAVSAVPVLIAEARDARGSGRALFTNPLTEIGPPAIPALLEAMPRQTDITVDHWIIQVLQGIGEPAVPALISELDDASPELRRGLLLAFQALGPSARSAAKPLRTLLAGTDPQLRAGALASLLAIDVDLEPLLPELEEEIASKSAEVRKIVIDAVARIGPRARSLLPALEKSILDPDPEIRAGATYALGRVVPNDSKTVDLLTKAAADPEPVVQLAAVRALGTLGEHAAPAVPQLIEAASSKTDDLLRGVAMEALGEIGAPAQPAMPVLEKALDDRNASIRSRALLAFNRIESDRDKLLTALEKALDDNAAEVRHPAIDALGQMREDARPAAPALFRLLDKDQDRAIVLESLRRIRVESVPLLIDALSHREAPVRIYACLALGRLGSDARDALPALQERYDDSYSAVRQEAREAVRRIERGRRRR